MICEHMSDLPTGGKQPGFSGTADAATTEVVTAKFEVTGDIIKIQ